MVGFRSSEEGSWTSFARGGPIYAPNSVGPVTSVPEFEAAVLEEVQRLDEEVRAAGDFDEELNVDELKVFTEEELVEKALQYGFDDGEHGQELVQSPEIPTEKSLNDSSLTSDAAEGKRNEINSQDKLKRRKKRGRAFDRDCRAAELEVKMRSSRREKKT